MIDIHCHLNFHKFEEDYEDVMNAAFSDGVKAIVNVGTQIESSRQAVELAEKYDNLWAIVGIHPHHADKIDLLPSVIPDLIGDPSQIDSRLRGNDNTMIWINNPI